MQNPPDTQVGGCWRCKQTLPAHTFNKACVMEDTTARHGVNTQGTGRRHTHGKVSCAVQLAASADKRSCCDLTLTMRAILHVIWQQALIVQAVEIAACERCHAHSLLTLHRLRQGAAVQRRSGCGCPHACSAGACNSCTANHRHLGHVVPAAGNACVRTGGVGKHIARLKGAEAAVVLRCALG